MVATVAGFQGTVTEVQEATRLGRIGAARWLVDNAAALKPSSSGTRTINLAAGSVVCGGVQYTETAATSISLPANAAAGIRLDIVGLRFVWNGASSTVTLFSKQGVAGSATRPALTRTLGGTYEVPIAVVSVRQNITTIAASDVADVRVWGGRGGPFIVPAYTALSTTVSDVPTGAVVQATDTGNTYKVTADYQDSASPVWALQSAASNAWTAYDPIVRHNGAGSIGAGITGLGVGGQRIGRYRVVDGVCYVQILVMAGSSMGANAGDYTIDLPPGFVPNNVMTQRWFPGYYRTTQESVMDWTAQLLVKNGENRGTIYAPRASDDCRISPARAVDASNSAGSGIPRINTTGSNIDTAMFNLEYPVV